MPAMNARWRRLSENEARKWMALPTWQVREAAALLLGRAPNPSAPCDGKLNDMVDLLRRVVATGEIRRIEPALTGERLYDRDLIDRNDVIAWGARMRAAGHHGISRLFCRLFLAVPAVDKVQDCAPGKVGGPASSPRDLAAHERATQAKQDKMAARLDALRVRAANLHGLRNAEQQPDLLRALRR